MRYYEINNYTYESSTGESDITVETVSEEDVRREYWPYWSKNMRSVGVEESMITFENCLKDWEITNMAIPKTYPTIAQNHPLNANIIGGGFD